MPAQVRSLRPTQTTRRGAALIEPLAASMSEPIQHPTGSSSAARAVREQIAQVARFNTTVLVLGESGTGKELAARQIHTLSQRAPGPFVPVNCGAIPSDLLESELFGHERGAFTGAITARQRRFEIAQGGTLFLDEIGEMSGHMQVKLLRVLQNRSFERVGSSETRDADVRIIAATNRHLEDEVRAGRFREDLYFRLNVFPIEMPALRDRPEDLPALVESFNLQLALRGHEPVSFTECALSALARHAWPGNIRELENLLERLSVMQPGRTLDGRSLPERYRAPADLEPTRIVGIRSFTSADHETGTMVLATLPEHAVESIDAALDRTEITAHMELPNGGFCLKSVLAEIERDLVMQALTRSEGVVSRAARLLRLGRTPLLEKMRKLQLVRSETSVEETQEA